MTDGVISLDDRPAIAAIDRANTGLDNHEKKTRTVLDRSGREWQVYGEGLVRVTDKTKSSLDRLLTSMQKQAELAGKTGVERMITQRDQLIAKWGQEQRAVEAINKAYEKMIAAQSGGGGWEGFGKSIANFVREPLTASKEAAAGLMEKLGTMGGVLAGGAAVLTAVAAAGYEAAKSLAEYGLRVKDAELRTGLTAREVGQFGFAARNRSGYLDLRTHDAGAIAGCRRQLERGRKGAGHHAEAGSLDVRHLRRCQANVRNSGRSRRGARENPEYAGTERGRDGTV